MINFNWPVRQQYTPTDLPAMYESFLETAKTPMYAHYKGKAETIKKLGIDREVNSEFPYSIAYSADYWDHDRYEDIFWHLCGPKHGECDKDHTYNSNHHSPNYEEGWCCPGIEIDEDFHEKIWNSDVPFYTKHYGTYENYLEKNDDGPVTYDHSHIGDWRVRWVVKTGYDYGVQFYQFRRKVDLDDFIVKTTLGPQYEVLEA